MHNRDSLPQKPFSIVVVFFSPQNQCVHVTKDPYLCSCVALLVTLKNADTVHVHVTLKHRLCFTADEVQGDKEQPCPPSSIPFSPLPCSCSISCPCSCSLPRLSTDSPAWDAAMVNLLNYFCHIFQLSQAPPPSGIH